MSICTLVSNSTIYNRKECSDLLEYATANRDNGIFNDVIIIAGHASISANRMVLSCFSKFFEKMFKSDMKERYQPTITIKQVDATAVQYLVDYMYEGIITVDSSNVIDILAAADFLLLDEVKEFCFEYLRKVISFNNWYAALSASQLYRSDHLQKLIYQFIIDNVNDIIQSSDFKSFTKNDMTSLILNLRESKEVVDETILCKLIFSWTKQDEDERHTIFVELFRMVNLKKIPLEVLQTIIRETLVKSNADCANALRRELLRMSSRTEKQCKEVPPKMQSSKIICLGGKDTGTKVIDILNTFFVTEQNYPDLPYDVELHCSLKLNDIIFCIGGRERINRENIYNKVYQMKLNETNLRWKEVASMNAMRCGMGGAVFNDCLIVAGGLHGRNKVRLASTEFCHDPFDKWRIGPTLKQKRSNNALAVCNESLFALGGYNGNASLSSVERLISFDDNWENVTPMSMARFGLAAVSLNGYIYVIGGQSKPGWSSSLNTVEKFDPKLNTWNYVCKMKHKRSFHCACTLHEKIIVIGGINADQNAVTEIEIYDPRRDVWAVSKHTKFSKYLFCATAAVTI